ncbi:chlorohydrolase [Streptococcus pneumoniae]|nr:chlorohydrolase [Streptococcus pneumoniae]
MKLTEVSSKHCFEVVDETDEVSNIPKSAQNMF